MARTIRLDSAAIGAALDRIAGEIAARCVAEAPPALIGIKKRGDHLARRLSGKISARMSAQVPVGAIDITFYRDDLNRKQTPPTAAPSDVPFEVEGRIVILVDDVLFTGRSVRAAINEILDYGRPRRIELAVLVDRGGRELPIAASYVGAQVATGAGESIEVKVVETDGVDEVAVLSS